MEYVVTGNDPNPINFGATGVEEILQNVRMILMTPMFSVPLDREFGVDYSILDSPIQLAQAQCSAQIFEAIRKYEPRVEITQIDFVQSAADALGGKLSPRVRLEVIA